MSLFKRGNVYWAYVYQDGVRHAKSTGTGNRRLAEGIEQKFKEELNLRRHNLNQYQPEMSFGELVAKFLAGGEVKAYHLDRLKILLPFFEHLTLGEISKGLVRKYRKERKHQRHLPPTAKKDGKPPRPLSETTLNRDVECLRHILFWAVEEGYMLTNPLSRMKLERERKKKRPIVHVEEEGPLLEAAAPHLRLIIFTALDAGMRRGEILSQRWQDVDFSRRLLFVTHSKTPEGEMREIPLTDRLFNLLREMVKLEGLIFTFEGKPIRSIKTAWKAALRRANLPYLPFHQTRHTFNTRLMETGVIRETRMALMGHSLGDDPQADYTQVELPPKRDAIRKLEIWKAEQLLQIRQQQEKGGSNGITASPPSAPRSAGNGSIGDGGHSNSVQ
jgi:integrase